jgi:raffinose/stachyose/melibiose transport system permease protein
MTDETTPAPRRVKRRLSPTPYLFIAPALVWYLIFLVYPMAYSFVISFFTWDGLSAKMTFIGFGNYAKIFFDDPVSQHALVNNIAWTIASLIVPTTIGLLLAVALNRKLPGTAVFRTIFYAPAVLPLVGVGLIWAWMYNPQFGAINVLLKSVGLGRLATGWLSNYQTALAATFVTYVWSSVGFPMILYLAGLQAINSELYDAARIDGARAVQIFRHVTLPGLKESHVVVLSLTVISGFKVFDLIYTMTYGGPGRSTQVLGTWMYFQAFQYYNAGYGSAVAWVIAAIVLVLAIPYVNRMARR